MAALLARVARGIRALAGKRDVGVFRRGDIVWELDPKEGIDFTIYLQGVRAPETLQGIAGSCSRSLSCWISGRTSVATRYRLRRWKGRRAASIPLNLPITHLESRAQSFSQPRLFQAGQRAPSYACGPPNPRKARGHPIQLAS
jgi:hypothetical protein